jgi:hypothetical protein
MARNLQHGKSVDGMSLKNALGISGTSQYAETLIKSFNWIQEASDYFDGRSQRDKEALFGVFNIADSQKVERY